jgi:hypothetical protein
MRRIALFTLFAILSFSISCFAQQKGKWGLSISNANTIGAAYFLEDKIRLSAELGFRSNGSGGSPDLSIGVGLWYYLAKVDRMNTFLGGGIGVGSDARGGQSTGSVSLMGQYGLSTGFLQKLVSMATSDLVMGVQDHRDQKQVLCQQFLALV